MLWMPKFRFASTHDIAPLLTVIRDFYECERLAFDPARTERLLREVMTNQQFGRVILFEVGADESPHAASELFGYMILTFGYSLEFGGRDALIDELYVIPAARGSGIGAQAIG